MYEQTKITRVYITHIHCIMFYTSKELFNYSDITMGTHVLLWNFGSPWTPGCFEILYSGMLCVICQTKTIQSFFTVSTFCFWLSTHLSTKLFLTKTFVRVTSSKFSFYHQTFKLYSKLSPINTYCYEFSVKVAVSAQQG